jgi:hypothetical protein
MKEEAARPPQGGTVRPGQTVKPGGCATFASYRCCALGLAGIKVNQTESNQIKPAGRFACPKIGHAGGARGRRNAAWSSLIKPGQSQSNRVKASQTQLNPVKPSQPSQTQSTQSNPVNPVKPSQTQSNQSNQSNRVKLSQNSGTRRSQNKLWTARFAGCSPLAKGQTESNRIKPNQTESNRIKPAGRFACPEIGHAVGARGRRNAAWSRPIKSEQTQSNRIKASQTQSHPKQSLMIGSPALP